jgi:GNAT superfamily N-acetyltransferase
MAYDIVRYSSEYAQQVAELQTHHWHGDPAVNQAHFEWKYLQNPYITPAIVHLAIADGRVVGMRGMFGSRWEVSGSPEAFIAPCTADLVITPQHRNRGLAVRIIEASVDDLAGRGYDYVFSLSAGAVVQRASLRAGWRSLGAIETASRSVPLVPPAVRSPTTLRDYASRLPVVPVAYRQIRNVTRWFRPKAKEPHHRPFGALDHNYAAAGRARDDGLSLDATPRPAAMAALVRRLAWDGRIRHVRDEQYLTWRYASPRSRFRFFFAGGSDLDGYLALRASRYSRGGKAEIVDWEATTTEVRTRLLAQAIAWGEFSELSIWSTTLPAEAQAALRHHGFAPPPDATEPGGKDELAQTIFVGPVDRPRLTAGDWSVGDRSLLDLANWDLRMIYRDI